MDQNPPSRHMTAGIKYWFMLAITLLMVDAVLIYTNFKRYDEQMDLVTHTYNVITEIEEVVSDLKDVHASQRGYVITGQQDYLTPYIIAVPKIEDHLKTLKILLSDNPRQSTNLVELKGEAEGRISIAEQIITAYQTEGQEKAFELVRSGIGKKGMDQIRTTAAEMVLNEKELLVMRQQKVDEAADLTLWMGGTGLGLCILILAVVFIMISRENRRRLRAEAVLKDTLVYTQTIAEQDNIISQMTDYLQGCQTTQEAFNLIEATMPRLLPGMPGNIYMFNSSRNLLESAASWGDSKALSDFTPDSCWALRRGQPHHHITTGSEPLCDHVKNPHPQGASLCLPMQANGDITGAFFIATDDSDTLDAHKQKAARRASEQISLAISNLKLQNKLRDQSIRDPLTGLFNRRYLEETMERELGRARRNGQPVSVLVLDIDHFKRYNDTRGHDAGDALLLHFARMLQKMTRKEDLACRYGGEEFVIVLPMADIKGAAARAELIRAATEEMKITLNGEVFGGITVSIGVSCFPAHGDSTEDLISIADKALYFAKNNGRNQVKAADV